MGWANEVVNDFYYPVTSINTGEKHELGTGEPKIGRNYEYC